jgi:thiamine kinase-like enzyme
MDLATFNRRKKNLRYNINNLSQTEHEEIFKILKTHDLSFTQNKNGIFVDISLLPQDILEKMEDFVEFCINNKIELDEYDKQVNECKINNTFDSIRNSVPLTKMLVADNIVDDWQGLLNEVKTNEKINAFVSLLESNSEKLSLKRANTKFINAKKKYSKKITNEKKNENDLQNNLTAEAYILYKDI